MPTPPNGSGSGSRQEKAAAMRAEMEARHKSPQSTQAQTETQEDADDEGSGPVGSGEYLAKVGDCMASIALDTGHFWETLWNDAGNADLKEQRQDPYVLLPGDRVTIPDLRAKEESGATEQRHRFVRKGSPEKLIVVFQVQGKPRENEAYTLYVDDETFEGTTDPNGRVEVFIPPNAKRGKIVFTESGDRYTLDLGKLDPITEISGVQKRLKNLGFFSGPADGKMSKALRQAIQVFQQKNDLRPTGDMDDATRAKLREEHDG